MARTRITEIQTELESVVEQLGEAKVEFLFKFHTIHCPKFVYFLLNSNLHTVTKQVLMKYEFSAQKTLWPFGLDIMVNQWVCDRKELAFLFIICAQCVNIICAGCPTPCDDKSNGPLICLRPPPPISLNAF